MKTNNKTIGVTKKFLSVFSVLLFFSNCGKECKTHTYNNYVEESYLPDIIPYSDTSTRLFLKNKTDTLLFKSSGLNNQIIQDGGGAESCDLYNLQKINLKMSTSDSAFFDIAYYTIKNGISRVKINIFENVETNEYGYYDFKDFSPPIQSFTILNIKYDTVIILYSTDKSGAIYLKPKFGVVKFQTPTNIYELIK
ncbi:MAG: hypothetical protein ACOYMA_07975 [Bacteroidia bacterium]